MGTGKYDTVTKTMRVPVDMQEDVVVFLETKGYKRPLYGSRVAAGSPISGDHFIEEHVSLNEYLGVPPRDVIFAHAKGDSMINAGINDGDLLVVDTSQEARNGHIVVVSIAGEQTVKRLKKTKGKLWLMPENPEHQPRDVTGNEQLHIVGVVKGAARKL
jgi:DNA polymerase V